MNEIKEALMTELTVPLWPTAGKALGLSRPSTYKAVERGEIPGAFRIGEKHLVATAPLRRRLGLNSQEAA